ncbi:MAG: ATP-binding protein [Verrucomicrobiota bacterium]
MKFYHSIRWRLQLWHGLLLMLVLVGFGYTAWQLERATQLQRVDQDLERRVAVIAGAMRRGKSPQDRPPQDRPPQDRPPQGRPPPGPPREDRSSNIAAPPPTEVRLSARDESLFEGDTGNGFYYVAWLEDGRQISRSESAPTQISLPERGQEPAEARSRGNLREYARFMDTGECIIVGRDISDEVAVIHRFSWMLGTAGSMVFLLALGGGWLISTRTLRPLAEIGDAATKIASGDLSQRIATDDTCSELGVLIRVLNDTFDRLQASFARQAQFTADASHELRTPISVVITQTQAALARERPASEYRDSLAACQRAAQRMRRLTESLLVLARLDSGEASAIHASCDLSVIASDVIDLLRTLAAQQNVSLHAELTPTHCIGNGEQLGQVVTNLVSNAITYNQPGGSVRVSVSTESNVVVLTVTDTGQGIAPEDMPHIFERFYRADPARTSVTGRSGLGLAITRAIVAAHGGSLEVTSEQSMGSTFTVRVPQASADQDGPVES